MSWQDRVRTEIKFISPEGNEFTALWRKNRKPIEKKLGIFNYPKLNGSIVQDLGINGTRYPLTIYFTGLNHDRTAELFVKAFSESGTWEVTHPIDGNLILQPVSINPDQNPTENGTYTLFQTEWIEPITEDVVKSTSELASIVKRKQIDLNVQASDQFNALQESAREKIAIVNAVRKFVNVFQTSMKRIYDKVSSISAKITAIRNQIESTITQTVINVAALAGQIQSLVQLPGLIVTDIKSKIEFYSEMANNIIDGFSPEGTQSNDNNTVLVQEIFLSSIEASMADNVIIADYETRTNIIDTIEDITDLFNDITNGLDDVMENFSGNDFDLQYYSKSESFSASQILLANIIAYLLRVSIDLKIEKTIRLEQDKTPIRVVIEEYGTLGEDDILLDLFIAANKLKNSEVLLMPGGKEVVVYV